MFKSETLQSIWHAKGQANAGNGRKRCKATGRLKCVAWSWKLVEQDASKTWKLSSVSQQYMLLAASSILPYLPVKLRSSITWKLKPSFLFLILVYGSWIVTISIRNQSPEVTLSTLDHCLWITILSTRTPFCSQFPDLLVFNAMKSAIVHEMMKWRAPETAIINLLNWNCTNEDFHKNYAWVTNHSSCTFLLLLEIPIFELGFIPTSQAPYIQCGTHALSRENLP